MKTLARAQDRSEILTRMRLVSADARPQLGPHVRAPVICRSERRPLHGHGHDGGQPRHRPARANGRQVDRAARARCVGRRESARGRRSISRSRGPGRASSRRTSRGWRRPSLSSPPSRGPSTGPSIRSSAPCRSASGSGGATCTWTTTCASSESSGGPPPGQRP